MRKDYQKGGAGNYLVIDHGDGFESKLFHAQSLSANKGDYLTREAIGKTGNTGGSKGAHIHWELRKNGKVLNPNDYLTKPIPNR